MLIKEGQNILHTFNEKKKNYLRQLEYVLNESFVVKMLVCKNQCAVKK